MAANGTHLLTEVFDNHLGGDQHEAIHRDAEGNLYLTLAETQERCSWLVWAGWGEANVRDEIADCVRTYGRRLGLNVASQCGGYGCMTPAQQRVVDAWNEKWGRE